MIPEPEPEPAAAGCAARSQILLTPLSGSFRQNGTVPELSFPMQFHAITAVAADPRLPPPTFVATTMVTQLTSWEEYFAFPV
jgi:hypothetical protein